MTSLHALLPTLLQRADALNRDVLRVMHEEDAEWNENTCELLELLAQRFHEGHALVGYAVRALRARAAEEHSLADDVMREILE